MLRRWVLGVAICLAAVVGLGGVLGQLTASADPEPIDQPGPLVVIGLPGTAWPAEDTGLAPSVDPLVQIGASGSVIPRARTSPTCTADGWLTLGAGVGVSTTDCQSAAVTPRGEGGQLTGWPQVVEHNDSSSRPGLLADTLRGRGQCVTAVGRAAAWGAADSQGRLAHYYPTLQDGALEACPVTLVDPGQPLDGQGDVDRFVTRVFDQVPGDATVVLVGLADAGASTGLRPLVVVGPGVGAGRVWSPSTRQPGVAQVADVTALALSRGDAVPDAVAGSALQVTPESLSPAAAARAAADDARAYSAADRHLTGWSLAAALSVVLVVGGLVTAWRSGHRPGWLRVAAIALGALPVASYLVFLAPWWRGSASGLWLTLGLLLGVAVVTALALAGPWRRWSGGPALVVAALTALVLGLDVVTGSRLQLLTFLGLHPLGGGRYYGMGNAGFGTFVSAVLLTAGLAATRQTWWDDTDRLDRRLAAGTVVVLGLVAVAVDGWPSWGADVGGPPALLVGTALLAALVLGLRISLRRVVLTVGVVAAVSIALAVVDWLRPAESRTHLGRFVQQVLDGEALGVIGDKLAANLQMYVDFPVALLVPVLLVVAAVALLRPTSVVGRPLAWLWEAMPVLRYTLLAVLACWTVALLLNDSGVGVPAAGGLVVGPLLAAVALAERDPQPSASR